MQYNAGGREGISCSHDSVQQGGCASGITWAATARASRSARTAAAVARGAACAPLPAGLARSPALGAAPLGRSGGAELCRTRGCGGSGRPSAARLCASAAPARGSWAPAGGSGAAPGAGRAPADAGSAERRAASAGSSPGKCAGAGRRCAGPGAAVCGRLRRAALGLEPPAPGAGPVGLCSRYRPARSLSDVRERGSGLHVQGPVGA